MICKECSNQIRAASQWPPHKRLRAPGSAGTTGYTSTANQLLYACSDCHTVLLKGRNTGWALAVKAQ